MTAASIGKHAGTGPVNDQPALAAPALVLRWTWRPLGYECHDQQNLKTMRGAKSNALLLRRANCNPACPCVALVSNPLTVVLRDGKW